MKPNPNLGFRRRVRDAVARRGARARRRNPRFGFSLLEVMIAMAILAGVLVALTQGNVQSVRASNRAKMLTAATLLARKKMIEVEYKLERDGFGLFAEDEETGDFADDGFPGYTWRTRVEKVELPGSIDMQTLLSQAAQGEGEGGLLGNLMQANPDAVQQGTDIVAAQFELVRAALAEAIRKATVTVGWKEGSAGREMTVEAYFTDPLQIGTVLAGGVAGTQGGAK